MDEARPVLQKSAKGRPKGVPTRYVGIKLPEVLMARLDQWRGKHSPIPTVTDIIYAALAKWLENNERQ